MSDRLDVEAIACPHCHAGVREHCVKPDGRPANKPHAKRRHVAEAALERKLKAPVPEAISGERWKRLYRACKMELEQRGDWTLLAGEQVEALVRCLATAETLRSKAEHDPLVQGSTHNQVLNPAFGAADRLDGRALTLAKALKLTPDTRGTSAPIGDVPDVGDEDEDGGDELSALDEVARKRKERSAQGGTGRGRR